MSIDNKLVTQLRNDEGVVSYAYQDSLGYWTIGVGRLIDRRKGGGLSSQEIDYLLANDIASKQEELEKALPWFKTLDDVRKRVLINMAFNLGVPGLMTFRNTLAYIKAGNFKAAAAGMLDSKWASQVGSRAVRLAKAMETGKD